MFSTVVAPFSAPSQWVKMVIWVWLHLLQANVSNQNFSADEDAINKPWRPLPSGRITEHQARLLRWTLWILDLAFSAHINSGVFFASFLLAIVEIIHDDFGWSHHPVLKNLCNVGGYTTFELGATLILCTCVLLKSPLYHVEDMALRSQQYS